MADELTRSKHQLEGMPVADWYVRKANRIEVVGPLHSKAVKSMAEAGFLQASDDVSMDNVQWHKASSVKGLSFQVEASELEISEEPKLPAYRSAPGSWEYEAERKAIAGRLPKVPRARDKTEQLIAVILCICFGVLGLFYSSWRMAVYLTGGLLVGFVLIIVLGTIAEASVDGCMALGFLLGVASTIASLVLTLKAVSDNPSYLGNHHYK